MTSNDWTTVAGYPSEAEALAQQQLIGLDQPSRFYRVLVLDEQPPKIEESVPADGNFGVGRFSTISIELSDATGVDTNSIGLTLGTNGSFTVSSPETGWSNNVFSLYLGGDTALGGYGATQTVSLAVSDTLGNSTNYAWSFELEKEIDAATNLFVFGSPDAQRSGQRLSGLSATVAARFTGPVRMSGSTTEWEIDLVTTNEIIISYSTNAPAFEAGQILANLAPAHVSEIFYRRVLSVSDNTASNLLTLGTEDVLIGEVMENGSFTLSEENAIFLEFDTNGTLVAAIDFNETIDLPVIGEDFSGTSLWSSGALDLSLPEGRFTLTPKLTVSLETEVLTVERFEARVSGDLNIACVPQLTVTGSYNDSISKELWRKDFWWWGWAGTVPVGVQWIGSITANAEIDVDATAQMSVGFRQVDTTWVSGSYVRGRVPASQMDRKPLSLDTVEKVPFTYTLDGNGSAIVSLVPQIDCRLYGAAGIYLNTNPRLELSGSATIVDQEVTYADFLIGAYADINVGLSLIGDLDEDLPPLPFNYFTKEWNEHYEAAPPPLAISVPPASQSATYGDNVTLSVQAEGGTGSYSYQWYQNGSPVPGAVGSSLQLFQVGDGHEGAYYVKVTSGTESKNSAVANLTVAASGGTGTTSGMAWIPGGYFSMGDSKGDGWSDELPVHSVYVSGFYMDRTEVTKAQWDTVYNWAVAKGYGFEHAGSGKASSHPVHIP